MSLITEVQALTTATTGLLTAVQASKAQLDGAVEAAEAARDSTLASNARFVVGTTPPDDDDGRPDGTVYVQVV
jgi:hypothetical protein